MKPGIYQDLSNDDYHAAPGISKSGLDLISKCPALYKARYLDGIKTEPTPAMILGSATHTITLEPEKFNEEFAVAPEINRRTKAGKAEWAQFQADNAGREIIKADDYETISRMADAVRNHGRAADILSYGQAESSLFYEDNITGELLKVRPDYLIEDLVVDLKTTQDASPEGFAKSCFNFRYHVQAAYYLAVARAVTGVHLTNFVFIAVEKKEPYQVAVYYLDNGALELGAEQYRSDLMRYSDCRKAGEWPGYNNNKITELSLPGWAYRR